RAAGQPQLRRGVPGAGAGLPRDARLPEGDEEAEGLDRAALRRGQGLARPTALPPARARQRQRRSPDGRSRAESETATQEMGLGAAPLADRRGRLAFASSISCVTATVSAIPLRLSEPPNHPLGRSSSPFSTR